MPELPDLIAFENVLAQTSLNQPIRRTSVIDRRILEGAGPRKLAQTLKNKAFTGIRRHGKFLFVRVGSGGSGHLALHFGMTGSLHYGEVGGGDPPDRHARVLFEFEDGWGLAYVSKRMLGQVVLTGDPDAFLEKRGIGPDALDGGLTPKRFAERAAGRTGMVKTLLMDQGFVAGIGNVYADEILFQCGIHPETRADRLGREGLQCLGKEMRRVLRAAAASIKNRKPFPDSFLLPHRSGGENCPRCASELSHTEVGGRSTWLCPSCQSEPVDAEV